MSSYYIKTDSRKERMVCKRIVNSKIQPVLNVDQGLLNKS